MLFVWVAAGGAGFGAYKIEKDGSKHKYAYFILSGIVALSMTGGMLAGKAIKAEYNSQSEVEEVKSLNETN